MRSVRFMLLAAVVCCSASLAGCSSEPPPAPAPAGDGKVKPPEVVKPTTAGDPRQP